MHILTLKRIVLLEKIIVIALFGSIKLLFVYFLFNINWLNGVFFYKHVEWISLKKRTIFFKTLAIGNG